MYQKLGFVGRPRDNSAVPDKYDTWVCCPIITSSGTSGRLLRDKGGGMTFSKIGLSPSSSVETLSEC